MKATPPPPPPVEPTPPPAADLPADQPPPESPPADPTTQKMAVVPDWFRGLDVVLGILAVVIALLAASFAARNSDVWLTLAGGRLVAQGDLHLGHDPFTFSGRPWVHTSWLADLAFYGLYTLDPAGGVLVAAKAALFAAAFGLTYYLRRPGQSLWPWAVFGVAGAIAAAPYAQVRPTVLSMLFLSLTLVMVYRLPWRPGSWTAPLAVAGLFLVWANCDGWFLLGPLTVALVLAGEYANRFLGPDDRAGDGGFWPAPPINLLARALAVGVVVCLLNPSFLAAAAADPAGAFEQLVPIEFGVGVPAAAAADDELAGLTVGPLSDKYLSPVSQGRSVNGAALAVLAAGAAAGLGLGFARVRATAVVLGVGFAVLAVQHVRLIPFFALVAAPVAAAQFNALAARMRLGPVGDPNTRVKLTAGGFGRVLTVIGFAALVVAAYPGWLHPPAADPALRNRVEWLLESDAGLERSARRVEALHESGALHPGGRGLNVNVAFGNYAAWFAPAETGFVNARYAFHRPELPDFLTVRRGLVGLARRADDFNPDLRAASDVLASRRVDHVIVAGARATDMPAVEVLTASDEWALVHLDGRCLVVGRADRTPPAARFDLVGTAFGPGVEELPAGPVVPPPAMERNFADDFLVRPKPIPPAADDAVTYQQYGQLAAGRARFAYQQRLQRLKTGLAAAAGLAAAVGAEGQTTAPAADAEFAAPLLALRAARRAVAAAPDRPEGYALLADAYFAPRTPVSDAPLELFGGASERQLQRIAGLRRCLDRFPPVGAATPNQASFAAVQGHVLFTLYAKTNQLDAAKAALEAAEEYRAALPPAGRDRLAAGLPQVVPDYRRLGPVPKPEDAVKAFAKQVEDMRDNLLLNTQRAGDRVRRAATPAEKFALAAQSGLPLLALEVYARVADAAEFGPAAAEVGVRKIALDLQVGRVEAAAADLERNADAIAAAAAGRPEDPLIQVLGQAQGMTARLAGDYQAALNAMPALNPPRVTWDAARDPAAARRVGGLSEATQAVVGGSPVLYSLPEGQKAKVPLFDALARTEAARQAQAVLLNESYYRYDQALLALVQGKTAEAKFHLEQAARPQGVPLAAVGDPGHAAVVAKYLELIDQAGR